MLFVIRDHIGVTPLANLQATLTADLSRIWDSLSKPTELKDRQLSDYFDLSFTALPHKILSADKFEAEVQSLRARFVDKEKEGYLFKPAYHKRIPADGVAFYMEGIWVSFFLRPISQLSLTGLGNIGTSPNEQRSRLADPTGTAGAVSL